MIAERQSDLTPVVKRIIVKCSAEDAFRFFTADFDKWWPAHTHSVIAMSSDGARHPAACTLDPRLGGRIIERGKGDETYVWGTVHIWEPPSRVAFSWHPGGNAETAQTVEVTFTRRGAGTEVMLTHGGWERLGEEGALTRDGYNNGWESVFSGAYRDYVEARG